MSLPWSGYPPDNAIRDFQTHTRSHGNAPGTKVDYARDTDTIAFARETLPTLHKHLDMAQNIQKEMKGGTPIRRR